MKHGSELLRDLVTPQASQVDIARSLGVSQQAVAAWVSGESKPLYERKLKLKELFGIPLESWDEAEPKTGDAA